MPAPRSGVPPPPAWAARPGELRGRRQGLGLEEDPPRLCVPREGAPGRLAERRERGVTGTRRRGRQARGLLGTVRAKRRCSRKGAPPSLGSARSALGPGGRQPGTSRRGCPSPCPEARIEAGPFPACRDWGGGPQSLQPPRLARSLGRRRGAGGGAHRPPAARSRAESAAAPSSESSRKTTSLEGGAASRRRWWLRSRFGSAPGRAGSPRLLGPSGSRDWCAGRVGAFRSRGSCSSSRWCGSECAPLRTFAGPPRQSADAESLSDVNRPTLDFVARPEARHRCEFWL